MDFLTRYATEISSQLNGELSPEVIQESLSNIVSREIGFWQNDFQKTMEAEMLIVNTLFTVKREDLKDFILQNL